MSPSPRSTHNRGKDDTLYQMLIHPHILETLSSTKQRGWGEMCSLGRGLPALSSRRPPDRPPHIIQYNSPFRINYPEHRS
nr:MAG TPA: hypothetical protein [Caudoviricetes sp.]